MFKIFLIACILLHFSSQLAYSATFNLSTSSSQISENDEISIDATLEISAQDGTEYFLRGAFNRIDSKLTCGITWNGQDWVNGPFDSDEKWKKLQKISIKDKSWRGTLKVKIDKESSYCHQSGTYRLRIQRFTQSGSAIYDDQNEILITVNLPTPTSTPEPIPTNTPPPKISPASKTIQSNPTMTIQESTLYTENLLKGKNALGAFNVINSDTIDATSQARKDITFNLTKPEKKIKIEKVEQNNTHIPLLFIGGALIASGCGILIHRRFSR